jgi:hypothetical protein
MRDDFCRPFDRLGSLGVLLQKRLDMEGSQDAVSSLNTESSLVIPIRLSCNLLTGLEFMALQFAGMGVKRAPPAKDI